MCKNRLVNPEEGIFNANLQKKSRICKRTRTFFVFYSIFFMFFAFFLAWLLQMSKKSVNFVLQIALLSLFESMVTQIIVAVVLVALAVFGLCVGIIFRGDHSFRSQDVGASKAMRDRGIYCTKTQDSIAQQKAKKAKK